MRFLLLCTVALFLLATPAKTVPIGDLVYRENHKPSNEASGVVMALERHNSVLEDKIELARYEKSMLLEDNTILSSELKETKSKLRKVQKSCRKQKSREDKLNVAQKYPPLQPQTHTY